MHKQKNLLNIVFLGSNDFINSLNELKEDLNFNLSILKSFNNYDLPSNYDAFLIEYSQLENNEIIKLLNSSSNKLRLLISKNQSNKNIFYDDLILSSFRLKELNEKIVKLVSRRKFIDNSSIAIKNYKLDKNEKKLKKENSYIVVTEKEIKLLELLLNKRKPISKKDILKEVWQYSSDADTHTVETHIYRLRKKIFDKFNDKNLIINEKEGYYI